MKRDIILTCEYTADNQKFFKRLETCGFEELKTMLQPLFCDVCCLIFEKVEGVIFDEIAFKGGFVALSFNIDEEDIPGSEHFYHSDMITFLNIHKSEYDEDPQKQFVVFENEAHEQVFSTQVYPVFLQDVPETFSNDMAVSDLWAMLINSKKSNKKLRKQLAGCEELKIVSKYR